MGLAHGTIGWADVAVPDAIVGAAFYTALFGWEARTSGDGNVPYTMFAKDGKLVAGMGQLPDEQADAGQPAMWTPYVIVDDVAQTHRRAGELGATILMEPMEIADAGSMFFVIDPVGAVVGFWQSGTHDGAEVFNEIDTMVWNGLGCRDVDAAVAFYTELLGWGVAAHDMGGETFTTFLVGDRPNASVLDISGTLPDDVPAHWMTWFRVADARDTASRASTLGGSVMREPEDGPLGTTAVLTDPAGAVFAIVETDTADGQPDR